MKEWVTFFTENTIEVINVIALLVIVVGTIEMGVTCLRAIFAPSTRGRELRDGYLRYARWLMTALTLQLATDIISSALDPSWEDIGRLAAIAVIRTFLNFFIERDILETQKIQTEGIGVTTQPEG